MSVEDDLCLCPCCGADAPKLRSLADYVEVLWRGRSDKFQAQDEVQVQDELREWAEAIEKTRADEKDRPKKPPVDDRGMIETYPQTVARLEAEVEQLRETNVSLTQITQKLSPEHLGRILKAIAVENDDKAEA